MSEEDVGDRDESETEESAVDDRPRRFRLKAGLRPLSDLLESLVEVSVTELPPPPADEVDWTTVDEDAPVDDVAGDYRRRDVPPRRERTERVRQRDGDEYLFDTRFDGDEFVVTADIPGASKDDISVGITRTTNELVIKKEGTVLERVTLPWDSVEPTRVWFNNGVLEIRVRRAESWS